MWIALTEAMALAALSGAEQTALAAQNVKSGKADPVPAIVASTIREAISALRAFPPNKIGAPGMIPDEMLDACLDLIRYKILNQLPLASKGALLTEQRIEAKKDALIFFDRIAAGKRLVEQPVPTDVSTAPAPVASGGAQVVRRSRDEFNRRDMRHL